MSRILLLRAKSTRLNPKPVKRAQTYVFEDLKQRFYFNGSLSSV